MALVDTSWLVAILNAEDAHHEKARERAEKPGPFVVPYANLAETLQVVTNRLTKAAGATDARRRAREILRRLGETPQFRFEATSEPQYRLAGRYYAREPRLSYFEAVAVAHAGGAELLTFDKNQLASHAHPLDA